MTDNIHMQHVYLSKPDLIKKRIPNYQQTRISPFFLRVEDKVPVSPSPKTGGKTTAWVILILTLHIS